VKDCFDSCPGCGACRDVCPLLGEYGTPDEILRERPEVSFYCTSCRRCDGVCPQGLSPSAAFFEVKRRMVRQDAIKPTVRKTLDGARRFAGAGHGFPFPCYQSADTVFWPGCSLAANRPGLVRRVRDILSHRLQKRVGLVLDCCSDPVLGLGDSETALASLHRIGERLRKGGVKQVITGCLNCHKLLSEHLGMECLFVLEALPPESFEKRWSGSVYLHHPCPASRWEAIRDRAKAATVGTSLAGTGTDYQSDPPTDPPIPEASAGLCCGNGGGLSALNPALANRFLERITREAAGRTIVTYCTGCQNRFLKAGAEAFHLLECLPGVKPRRKLPSPLGQWVNRFALALAARIQTGKFLIGLIFALIIAGGVTVHEQQLFSTDLMLDLLGRHPVLAPLIFLGVYAITPSLFLPSIPLTLAAGFFWGPLWGIIFSITGATIGSCPPFFLARHLFQETVRAKVAPERWEWLQGKVVRHGWKAVAFTRLVPVFPFNLLNYLFGLTPIPFGQYLGSTALFMLPGCIAFVAFGSSLGELILRGNIRGVVIGLVVAAIALILPLALRPYFRRIEGNKPEKPSPRNENLTGKEI
jgi:uncharacterized membrane protein YdjX (TVP38/TMEM64 family)/Fe-S oxidoreductase